MERDRYEYSSFEEKKLQKRTEKSPLFVFQYESTSTTNKTLNKTLRITANETPSSESEKV